MAMNITMLEDGDRFCTMTHGALAFWQVDADGRIIRISNHVAVINEDWRLDADFPK